MLSDYLGVPEMGADGKFYYILNNNGGKVYVSTDIISQNDFRNIVINTDGTINIVSGVHGDLLGNTEPHSRFYSDDMREFGDMPNARIHNLPDLEFGDLYDLINTSDTTIMAWCYSERDAVIRMGLKLRDKPK